MAFDAQQQDGEGKTGPGGKTAVFVQTSSKSGLMDERNEKEKDNLQFLVALVMDMMMMTKDSVVMTASIRDRRWPIII